MATYAIGDIQGCYQALLRLLAAIQFDAARDTLWFSGDLVNRGPASLEVLRYVKALGPKHRVVLGNHEIHLLAVYYKVRPSGRNDTLAPILAASDCAALINWLRAQPLIHWDATLDYCMVHAGLAPSWSLAQALALAGEVSAVLRGHDIAQYLQQLFGNHPNAWQETLQGTDRLRVIVNYFTRLRYCEASGAMDFTYKGKINTQPAHLLPWYAVKNRATEKLKIIFGHWAALEGNAALPRVYALDTGCVWGGCLTAMRLEDRQRFQVSCA